MPSEYIEVEMFKLNDKSSVMFSTLDGSSTRNAHKYTYIHLQTRLLSAKQLLYMSCRSNIKRSEINPEHRGPGSEHSRNNKYYLMCAKYVNTNIQIKTTHIVGQNM